MVRTLVFLFLCLSILSPAWGQSVTPQDLMAFPRIIGGMNLGGGVGPMAQVIVTGVGGGPLDPGDIVRVILNPACSGLCPCAGWIFSGLAVGPMGTATARIDCMFGGCCLSPGAARIDVAPASGAPPFTIRTYNAAVSPDWDGGACNNWVNLPDFIFFGNSYVTGVGGCSDYDGDGRTALSDFVWFAANWARVCP